MDPIEEIKQLYFQATAQTIQRDVDRAIDLLKTLPDEDARERVAVYMDGLAQMRSEWKRRAAPGAAKTQRAPKPAAAKPETAKPETAKPSAAKTKRPR